MLKNKLFTHTPYNFQKHFQNALTTLLSTDRRVTINQISALKHFQNTFQNTQKEQGIFFARAKHLRARR